ncbi:hypothetical protein R2R35_06260 [Anaerocolumna sp. AGMB13020]|uniref:hypothetical protein n=1 Tax=Anaerocolumna sp. AGMB13020 TaxID=3081750 RepID=UPI002954E4C8|nr:hypothetical protein [Anaerocolumna sp. AGMB13020]WOO38102.1 hypothetical protein R2R35_06260 [Anaerocolumna sp. AGMB13020]
MIKSIDTRLAHLSENQIKEIISKYLNKEYKLSDIISEYKIDIAPKGLYNILPSITLDMVCEHCGNHLLQKVKKRTQYSDKEDIYCANCGHIMKSSKWSFEYCKCIGCNTKRRKVEENKKEIISKYYVNKNNNVEFKELTLKEQLLLFFLIKKNVANSFTVLLPFYDEDYGRFSGTADETIENYNILLEKNIISVSPRTKISAFDVEEFPKKVDLCRATFDININFTDEIIKALDDNTYFKIRNYSDEDLLELWKEYIYKDAIDKFEKLLEERGLRLYKTEEADENFKKLIDKISYVQLTYLCYKVTKNLSDDIASHKKKRQYVIDTAYESVSRYYENAIRLDWDVFESNYKFAGDNLKYFIHYVLGKDLSILKEIPAISILENYEAFVDKGDNRKNRYKRFF